MGRSFQTLIPLAATVFMGNLSRAGAQAVTVSGWCAIGAKNVAKTSKLTVG